MVPESVIMAIKGIDILDVCSPYLPTIKKSGANYAACCPFHEEKTPSFYLMPAKGIYKCFGCGAGGDAISFVMSKEGVEFPDAVEMICDRHGIEYVRDSEPDEALIERQRALHINKTVCVEYRRLFKGSQAETYMQTRGFDESVLNRFSVGYTGEGMKSMIEYMLANGVNIDEMLKYSLAKQGDYGCYDFFRNRVVFPVTDHMGRVIAFSARALQSGQKPKYVNSSDTILYSKSRVLYGLHQAKASIVKHNQVVVVEGAPDVIAMHQYGFDYTVGTLGTSLTTEHARLIKKYTKNVLLMYDGDVAGLKAVFRACMPLFENGLYVKICRLPDGHDPDTFVREFGRDAALEYVRNNSRDFVDFRMSLLSDSVSDKILVAKEMKEMIMKFPDADARQIMLHEYGKRFGFSMNVKLPEIKKKEVLRDADPQLHVLRVALMYGVDDILKYNSAETLGKDWMTKYFRNDSYRLLAERIFKDNVTDITLLAYTGDSALNEAVQRCMNVFLGTDDAEFDKMYTLMRFDDYLLSVHEMMVKTGRIEMDEQVAKRQLVEIKSARRSLRSEIEKIVSQRKKQHI